MKQKCLVGVLGEGGGDSSLLQVYLSHVSFFINLNNPARQMWCLFYRYRIDT